MNHPGNENCASQTHPIAQQAKGILMWRHILLSFLINLCLWTYSSAAGRVLVVHSYHEDYDWTREINSPIEAHLRSAGVEYQIYFMDTKNNPGEAWKNKSAQEAKRLVGQYKPSVVIAVDDNAQAYFVKSYVNRSPIQFVFCGVNAEPEAYGYPADNVTGILERTYPAQTLRVLKTILPKTRRVAVITDKSTTADLIWPRIQERVSTLSQEISIFQYHQPVTFSSWKQVILKLDQNSQVDALMIPLYHTVRNDGADTSVDSKEVMAWTVANTRKPVVGLWPQMLEDQGLLAVTVDPSEHGRVAASMALEILSGKRAADIPIQTNQDGYVMINLKGKQDLAYDLSLDIDQIADRVIR